MVRGGAAGSLASCLRRPEVFSTRGQSWPTTLLSGLAPPWLARCRCPWSGYGSRGVVTPERESPSQSYCRVTLCAPTSCACVAFMRQVVWKRPASSSLGRRARAGEFRIKSLTRSLATGHSRIRDIVYNIGEVFFVDRMAEHLVGRLPGAPRQFILSEVEDHYVSPRPYAYSKARVALQ